MKKVLSVISMVFVLATCTMLVACGGVTQKYADKINKAADEGKHYTYERVIKDLGDDVVSDATVAFGGGNKNGIITAKKDNAVLVVTIADGKATLAVYSEKEE